MTLTGSRSLQDRARVAAAEKRPFLLGLTGSIGMGKSTTLGFFAEADVPVWDADATVRGLYAPAGSAVPPLAAIWPEVLPDAASGIDRTALKRRIATEPDALARIEAIVHPLVAADRARFVARAQAEGRKLVVLDIPLLYETGADRSVDAVLVVSAPASVQWSRVMSRPGMSQSVLDAILARQMPDGEKCRRADVVFKTTGLDAVRAQVRALIVEIEGCADA